MSTSIRSSLLAVAVCLAGCGVENGGLDVEAPAPDTIAAPDGADAEADSPPGTRSTEGEIEATPAPGFTLPGTDGYFSLSEHRGKVVVLNFWATWNELSVEGMDALEDIHREFSTDGIQVVGVAQDEDGLQRIEEWLDDRSVGFPIVADTSHALARAYGNVEFLPTTVIIDREGMIREQHTGILTRDELLDLLGPILIEGDEPLSEAPTGEGEVAPQILSPVQAHVLVGDGAMLVDLRPEAELARTGTALHARRKSLETLLPDDLPANYGVPIIFLSDGVSKRDLRAAEQALQWGYASVYVVEGGFAAWRDAGLPTTRPEPDGAEEEEQPLVRTRSVIG